MMKNLVLLVSFLSLQIAVYGDISIKPQIKEVTVYTSGALVKSKAEASLVKGTYNLVFENVSQFIDENTVQLKGNADFTILSITVNKDFLNEGFKDNTFKKLEDSLAVLNKKMSLLTSLSTALTDELGMLKANQKIGGSNLNLSVVELEKMATYYRTRVEEIHNKQYDISVQEPKLQEKINAIQDQINTYNAENSKNLADIIVSVKSNIVGNVEFELTYQVGNVGWSPFYDIRAESTSSPVVVCAKANVWQNTGENWKDVKLFISTGNPSLSNNIPTFNPYYLAIYPEYQRNKTPVRGGRGNAKPMAAPMAPAAQKSYEGMAAASDMEESNSTMLWTNNIESTTNNIFDITIPYSIKTDGKPNTVDIQKYEIPAKFSYIARPKQEAAAFLEAKISDWNQSGLLTGEASVYFDGSYVGKTIFETNLTSDTMSISFGRDNNISIQRKRVKLLNDKAVVANNKSIEVAYEISVKNRKKTEVEIAKKEAERLNALAGSITPQTLMKEAIDKWDGSGIPPTVSGEGMSLLVQPKNKKAGS
jgi:uncharacterized protein (TIGR02231 family)